MKNELRPGFLSLSSTFLDVIDDGTDERPVGWVARVKLHGDLDPRGSGRRIREAMDRVRMGD
jgi:hypothetical protein